MTTIAFILSVAAFTCLGLVTNEHHHRVTERRLSAAAKGRWRAAASIALALAFCAAVVGRGWNVGPIAWLGLVILAAGIVFLMLNLAPRQVASRRDKAAGRAGNVRP